MRCSKCKSALFCSRKCQVNSLSYCELFIEFVSGCRQRRGWKFHKHECRIFAEEGRYPPASLMLVLRVLLAYEQERSGSSETPVGFRLRDFIGLCTNWSRQDAKRQVEYGNMSLLIAVMSQRISGLHCPDVQFLSECFARLHCNSFSICDEELVPVGVGVFPLLSYLNHSCSANAVVSFDYSFEHGGSMAASVRAVREIAVDEAVTISYIDSGLGRCDRQKILQQQYFFSCSCKRCLGPPRQGDTRQSELADEVQRLLNAQDWTGACQALENATPFVEDMYKHPMPQKALHYLKLGKLALFLSNFSLAQVSLLKALDVLRVCYGDGSRLATTAILMLQQAQTELDAAPTMMS